MRVHSNLPKTARRAGYKGEEVTLTRSYGIGGESAVEQEEIREAKATITLRNYIGTGKAVALSLCAHDHLSSKSGKIMSMHRDSLHTSEQGQ